MPSNWYRLGRRISSPPYGQQRALLLYDVLPLLPSKHGSIRQRNCHPLRLCLRSRLRRLLGYFQECYYWCLRCLQYVLCLPAAVIRFRPVLQIPEQSFDSM
jgi:hypothetical protein